MYVVDSIEELTDDPRMTVSEGDFAVNWVLDEVFTWSTKLKPVNEFY